MPKRHFLLLESIRKEVANKVNKEGAKKLDNELKIVPNIQGRKWPLKAWRARL